MYNSKNETHSLCSLYTTCTKDTLKRFYKIVYIDRHISNKTAKDKHFEIPISGYMLECVNFHYRHTSKLCLLWYLRDTFNIYLVTKLTSKILRKCLWKFNAISCIHIYFKEVEIINVNRRNIIYSQLSLTKNITLICHGGI